MGLHALPLLLLVSMHARRGAASLVVGTAEHLLLWGDPALTANTTLVPQTHPPAKTGTMVVLPDKPWENLIFAYTSVLKVSDTDYRIYYDAFGSQKNASHRFFCVATSTDGRVHTKPDLGLVAFQGSNATIGAEPRPIATTMCFCCSLGDTVGVRSRVCS